jgi:hypothetical protein
MKSIAFGHIRDDFGAIVDFFYNNGAKILTYVRYLRLLFPGYWNPGERFIAYFGLN